LVDVFLDLHITLLKKSRQLFAAFQKSFMNPGKILTNRKEGIKIQKRKVNVLPVFKRVL
jgi:hypothetical protein